MPAPTVRDCSMSPAAGQALLVESTGGVGRVPGGAAPGSGIKGTGWAPLRPPAPACGSSRATGAGSVVIIARALAAMPVDALAEDCFNQMVNGVESFWTAVYRPFMTRDLTRKTVREIVYKGLRQTKGSYTALAPLFNVQPGDYKRMHSFLQQHD